MRFAPWRGHETAPLAEHSTPVTTREGRQFLDRRQSGEEELTLASARGKWVLSRQCSARVVATLDASVVGIALPVIGRDFHAGVAALQWVTTRTC